MNQDTSSLVNAVKAENILAGSVLLTQINELRENLRYKTGDKVFSYDDYYLILASQIEKLPHISLQSDIAPRTETQYQIKLATALEALYDDCERIECKMLHFQSKLKVAQNRIETLQASFVAWYSIAANQYLSSYDMKLPSVTISALAKAEFERLMESLDVEVASLVEAVAVQIKIVTKRKKMGQDLFNLGKDQANAAWTGSLLPGNLGVSSDPGATDLLNRDEEEEDEEEMPQFISREPKISQNEVDEVRGVFLKYGDPMPTKSVDEILGDE